MTTGPFDDELLNAVIDGTADDATVAAVQADPVASSRLAQLRQVVELVGATPPPASPERRASSIAAAMAAAQPSAPEGISSLAAARHAREEAATKRREIPRGWLAAAAAVLVVALGIPILNSLGGSDADTVATDADTAADSFSAGSDDSSDDGAADSAMADEAMEESDAMADDGDAEMAAEAEAATDADEVAGDDAGSDDAAVPTSTTIASEQRAALAEFGITPLTIPEGQIPNEIESGLIAPTYAFDDEVIFELVAPECLADLANTGTTEFDLVIRTPDDRLTLIGFNVDGSFLILDAETCDVLG